MGNKVDVKADVELMAGVVEEQILKARVLLDDLGEYFRYTEPNQMALTAIANDYKRIAAKLAIIGDVLDGMGAAIGPALEEKAVG